MNELKTLPHSVEAEQMILSSILINNNIYYDINSLINSEMFYFNEHKIIFDGMTCLLENKKNVDALTLYDLLNSKNEILLVGGVEYINSLVESAINSNNCNNYATIIKEKFQLREAIKLSQNLIEECYNNDNKNVDDIISTYINNFSQHQLKSDNKIFYIDNIIETIQQIHQQEEDFIKFNNILDAKFGGGIARGEFIILAAKAGMGKTATAISLFNDLSITNKCIYFSLEMSLKEITKRIYSNITKSEINNHVTKQNLDAIIDGLCIRKNLAVIDNPRITIQNLKRYIIDYKLQHKTIDVVFIDYLQLLQRPVKMSEYEAISYFTRELKLLAQEFKIAIICLSQLNRGGSERREKRPILADLRGSGSIEQDSDMVIFLHREAYYYNEQGLEIPTEVDNMMEFIVAKFRRYSPCKILFECNLKYSIIDKADYNQTERYNNYLNKERN